jgi:hypothetical protein
MDCSSSPPVKQQSQLSFSKRDKGELFNLNNYLSNKTAQLVCCLLASTGAVPPYSTCMDNAKQESNKKLDRQYFLFLTKRTTG